MKVIRSNHTDALLSPLARALREPLDDPFVEQTVVVNSQGMQRWLAKQLAQQLGICARVRFPFPGTIIQEAFAAALGERALETSAWRADTLQWAVLARLPQHLARPEFHALAVYLRGDPELQGPRSFQLAQRIAATFDRYITYRPEMVLRWSQGEGDDWQALLWRDLDAHFDQPHLAGLAREFFAAAERGPLRLPGALQRVCLFGISSLPPFYLKVLACLARHADVRLFLQCPSDQYWGDLRSEREGLRQKARAHEQGIDPAELHFEVGHPLLASFGRLGRDFQVLLESLVDYQEPEGDLFRDPQGPSLLATLQADIRHLRARGDGHDHPPLPFVLGDASIRLHSCHSPIRQVEVLQDQLLHLFHTLPELKPRDVVVMTPDIETYAPLIEAVFGNSPGDARFLPCRVADRALRSENPVAEAFLRVLELVGKRLTASRVLDLLALEPVLARFELTAADLERISTWIAESGIRWGIDARDRASHAQPALRENTWRFGLDRLLLGYAMPGKAKTIFAGVLPYDEVEGGEALLLGKLAELSETLFALLRTLGGAARPLADWSALLPDVLEGLIASTDASAWQHVQVREALDQLTEAAARAGFSGALQFEVVRDLLLGYFGQERPATAFLTGSITVCGMVPMRSIPFRVVCLLGLDDGAFPRAQQKLGFDLVAQQPRVGERTVREDDRYLFLEALLAARERLLITYTGQSIRDNKALPPSVVVSELLDSLCASNRHPQAPADDPEAARALLLQQLLLQHPLQPFSPRNFGAEAEPDVPALFSYAAGYLEGARALNQEPRPAPPFFTGSIPERPASEQPPILLRELVRFFEQPIKALLTERLGLWLGEDAQQIADREPLALNGLESYAVASPLLARRVAGEALNAAYPAVRAAGQLPLGTPGQCQFDDLAETVEPVAEMVLALRGEGPVQEPVEVELSLGGELLLGRIDMIWPWGQIRHNYARMKARYQLGLWIRHLVLQCVVPDRRWRSALVARGAKDTVETVRFGPVAQPAPILAALLGLWRAGMQHPLLFFPETSRAYAEKVLTEPSSLEARAAGRAKAQTTWQRTGDFGPAGESQDPYLQRVLGGSQPFAEDFALEGLVVPEGQTFHDLALQIWGPLLAHVEETA